jgi:hypothetical protein
MMDDEIHFTMDEEIHLLCLKGEEGQNLEFKRGQYPLNSDTEKSEILKDIIGFANSRCNKDSYILIGVKERQGEDNNIIGIEINDHLQDHNLQQIINSKLNRPINFSYRATTYKGKQIGILSIDRKQDFPIFLKKDFGKLQKYYCYIRRGTSTDITNPLSPDDIVLSNQAELKFGFYNEDSGLSDDITSKSTFLDIQIEKSPSLSTNDSPFLVPLIRNDGQNENYDEELSDFLFKWHSRNPIQFAIQNLGRVNAEKIEIEFNFDTDSLIKFFSSSDMPDKPEELINPLNHISKINYDSNSDFSIIKNDRSTKVIFQCRYLQPGRTYIFDTIYLLAQKSEQVILDGEIFAANLNAPHAFKLKFNLERTDHELTQEKYNSIRREITFK